MFMIKRSPATRSFISYSHARMSPLIVAESETTFLLVPYRRAGDMIAGVIGYRPRQFIDGFDRCSACGDGDLLHSHLMKAC